VIRVAIQSDVMADGVRIGILQRGEPALHPMIGRVSEQGHIAFEYIGPADQPAPTLVLQDDIARALMDELIRHYHGSGDTLALRRDYDHERQRYDKAVAALIELAARPQQLHVHKAEQ
jgi:hypothetical protein